MTIKTKIDAAGRIVIPKALRDRYGFDRGKTVQIIPLHDGVSIVPEQRQRRFLKLGPILAIDTGTDSARLEDFDVDQLRNSHLEDKQS